MQSPSTYETRNNELNQRYVIIVDEIVKTYPNYKASPKFNSYSQAYERNMGNLQRLQTEYFLFKNNLIKDTNELQKDIKQIDDMIYELEEETKVKREEYAYLKNSDNAAHGQLTDSKYLYNQQLLGNWLLFLTFSGMTYNLFKTTF
jgi:septal ring factor EnvC (AmiA/AmiB activator)